MASIFPNALVPHYQNDQIVRQEDGNSLSTTSTSSTSFSYRNCIIISLDNPPRKKITTLWEIPNAVLFNVVLKNFSPVDLLKFSRTSKKSHEMIKIMRLWMSHIAQLGGMDHSNRVLDLDNLNILSMQRLIFTKPYPIIDEAGFKKILPLACQVQESPTANYNEIVKILHKFGTGTTPQDLCCRPSEYKATMLKVHPDKNPDDVEGATILTKLFICLAPMPKRD